MLFDNRWNQHTYTSLMLLPFGLWAPGNTLAIFTLGPNKVPLLERLAAIE